MILNRYRKRLRFRLIDQMMNRDKIKNMKGIMILEIEIEIEIGLIVGIRLIVEIRIEI